MNGYYTLFCIANSPMPCKIYEKLVRKRFQRLHVQFKFYSLINNSESSWVRFYYIIINMVMEIITRENVDDAQLPINI